MTFTNTQIDQTWLLQGRLIPPSCTKGDGCILHLQTRSHSWATQHFHTVRLSINMETGVEFVSSLLLPIEEELVRESFHPDELGHEVEYLAMAKLYQPEHSIAFPTVAGLTIIIQNTQLDAAFAVSEKCNDCRAQESVSNVITMPHIAELEGFDSLMELTGSKERSH
jgi:hypothetical protein